MKKRLLAFFLVFVFSIELLSMSAFASMESSQYIFSSEAIATGGSGSGYITVSFNITGKSNMTDIGATIIDIKDSSDNTVYTFTNSVYATMMGHNRVCYNSSVTFYCTAYQTYHAVVTFYAGNSSGSDSVENTTNIVLT